MIATMVYAESWIPLTEEVMFPSINLKEQKDGIIAITIIINPVIIIIIIMSYSFGHRQIFKLFKFLGPIQFPVSGRVVLIPDIFNNLKNNT